MWDVLSYIRVIIRHIVQYIEASSHYYYIIQVIPPHEIVEHWLAEIRMIPTYGKGLLLLQGGYIVTVTVAGMQDTRALHEIQPG